MLDWSGTTPSQLSAKLSTSADVVVGVSSVGVSGVYSSPNIANCSASAISSRLPLEVVKVRYVLFNQQIYSLCNGNHSRN